MAEGQLDRVSYSFGRKLNTAKFETADVHISYSTDVRKGETMEDALDRAIAFVEPKVMDKCDEIRDACK
jgi:hypothetical protein